ncbi:MAG: NAD(P)-dependent oxidoreductase [Candidatus Hydrogenedentes bacterium]|nr:NAD(P)-dependent oxidoreductase [Candidatus Hydrogenedentota bacterium]
MHSRILITGGNGFVAGSLIRQGAALHELHVLSRGPAPGALPTGVTWHTLQNGTPGALIALVEQLRPDALLHTAAIANIDYCEAHREEAHTVNVGLTQALCDAATCTGAKFIYLSTDNVFDGVRGRYTEEDRPSPANYYGETKAEAEGRAALLESPWVVARVSLVMGLPLLGTGNSFLSRMIPTLERGEALGVPPDEIRSPIDAVTLGQALLELAVSSPFTGYLHLAGDDIVNRYEMVRRVAAALGYDAHLVVANDPATIPGRANRPRDGSLVNGRAHAVLQTPLCGLEEGVRRVLAARDRYGMQ